MIKELTTLDELEAMANKSAPCWEGLSLEGLEEALKDIDPNVEIAYCTGKTYDDAYGLKGGNRYPDDLTIVFLDKFSIGQMDWKFKYNCRWADDVRDNNLRREGR